MLSPTHSSRVPTSFLDMLQNNVILPENQKQKYINLAFMYRSFKYSYRTSETRGKKQDTVLL